MNNCRRVLRLPVQMRFWNSEPMFSGVFPHEILSQFSTCSLWCNALLVIRRCLKFDRNSNPTLLSMSRRPKIKDYQSTITWKSLSYLTWERGGLYSNACGRGGEKGLESLKLLTSFIQQMHEMKPRNVWPKSPNLKMSIFIFFALDVCCRF